LSSFTFEFEEFTVYTEDGLEGDCKAFLCHVDLVMTEPEQAPVMHSLNDPGEPGWPAEFEITCIILIDIDHGETDDGTQTRLELTETQFTTFFPGGADVVNNAFEWAAEQEVDHD